MKSIPYLCLTFMYISCSPVVRQSDEDMVKNVVLDFVDDFNEGSFRKAESYATMDWDHINPGGGIDLGREATLKGVRTAHQSFLKGAAMTTDSMRVRFIVPEVALVIAYHTMDDFTTPDGVKHIGQRQIKSYVLVKQAGKWMLTLDQNTNIQ